MLISEFMQLTLEDLEYRTGIRREQWSRYFNKKTFINEATLNQAAKKLSLEPHELLLRINHRRAAKNNIA
jgi:transcriptional regulator with XRE-family HTH domain